MISISIYFSALDTSAKRRYHGDRTRILTTAQTTRAHAMIETKKNRNIPVSFTDLDMLLVTGNTVATTVCTHSRGWSFTLPIIDIMPRSTSKGASFPTTEHALEQKKSGFTTHALPRLA